MWYENKQLGSRWLFELRICVGKTVRQILPYYGVLAYSHQTFQCLQANRMDGWMEGFHMLYFRTSEDLIGQPGTITMRLHALVAQDETCILLRPSSNRELNPGSLVVNSALPLNQATWPSVQHYSLTWPTLSIHFRAIWDESLVHYTIVVSKLIIDLSNSPNNCHSGET